MRQLALITLILAAATAAQAATLTIPVDQTRRLTIEGAAASISVGNKDIADVKPIDSRTLMVFGKRPGVTNVVVFDGSGRTLFDDLIQVSAAPGAAVTIYRGSVGTDYACSPYCQAVPSASGAAPAQVSGAPAAAAAPAATGPAAPPPTSTPSLSPAVAPH